MASLYEFIYTYRNNMYDDIPNVDSKSFSKALSMIKKIKSEISSGNIYIYIYAKEYFKNINTI